MSAADGARLTPSGRIRHAAVEILAALEDLSRLAPRPEACAGFVCGGFFIGKQRYEPGAMHDAPRECGFTREHSHLGGPVTECICANCGKRYSQCVASREPATERRAATVVPGELPPPTWDDEPETRVPEPAGSVVKPPRVGISTPVPPEPTWFDGPHADGCPEPATQAQPWDYAPDGALPTQAQPANMQELLDEQLKRPGLTPNLPVNQPAPAPTVLPESVQNAVDAAFNAIAAEGCNCPGDSDVILDREHVCLAGRCEYAIKLLRSAAEGLAREVEHANTLARVNEQRAQKAEAERDAEKARADAAVAECARIAELLECIKAESRQRRERLEAAEAALAELRSRWEMAVPK